MNNCECKPCQNQNPDSNQGPVMEFNNRSMLEVRCGDNRHTLFSNEVETKKLVIRIRKFVDKECVVEGEALTYATSIKNECNINLTNVEFFDIIPNGLEFERGSFKVDGHDATPRLIGQRLSFNLDELPSNHECIITFKAKVM